MPSPLVMAVLSAGLLALFGYPRPRRAAASVAVATLSQALAVLFAF